MLAQTALELIYNWWVVVEKKVIIGKDSENISASSNIRLLPAQLNMHYDAPESFKNFKEFLGELKLKDTGAP